MRRLLFLLPAALVAWPSFGQGLMQRKRPEIIPLEGQARRVGWFVEPGLTYTLNTKGTYDEEVFRNADTLMTARYDPQGQFGLFLGAGLAWYTRDPAVVDYFDLGLAYKNLRGRQSLSGQALISDVQAMEVTGDSYFKIKALSVYFNANKFVPTWNYQFVQLSLGVNADFDLGGEQGSSLSGAPVNGSQLLSNYLSTFVPWSDEASPYWRGEVHLKVGYGFKVTGRMLIIPAVETPVFTLIPDDVGLGQLGVLGTRYRPLILTVRFLFLRPRQGFDCPPPIKHNALEKGRSKTYKPAGYHP